MPRRHGPQGETKKEKVWAVHKGVWQMRDCHGNAARNFRGSRMRDGLNFAPNKSTTPTEHKRGY